jgi:hypothetical protein
MPMTKRTPGTPSTGIITAGKQKGNIIALTVTPKPTRMTGSRKMLNEQTLFGGRDKVAIAIARIKEFEPMALQNNPAGYYVCISGGKDSSVIQEHGTSRRCNNAEL